MDANDWLTKHRPGHFICDRVCGGLNDETLVPGDVDDRGNAMTLSGLLVTGREPPALWMNLQQAKRAEYYGWRWVGDLVAIDPGTSKTIYAMSRKDR